MITPRRLAIVALALGFVAMFLEPRTDSVVTIDTAELARLVEDEVDHITVEDLADDLLQGVTDLRVIDLRAPEEYASYHIPTAENIPVGDLEKAPLSRNETIVLYSGGGIHSAQAWFLLQARGFKGAVILLGGLEQWKHDILFPTLAENAPPEEVARWERLRHVSELFGGTPRLGGAAVASTETMVMPEVAAPPPLPSAARGKRKAKEGC